MSFRGVRFDFEPGELVLCFEPDPTKARVLYDAKILERCVAKDYKGRKKSGYQIHFQGWNSSWDRIVPGSFILSNTEDNRNLMLRLATTAKQIRNNKRRKRKIDNLLKKHLGKMPKFDYMDNAGSITSSTDEDDDDDDDDESGDDDDESGGEDDESEDESDDESGDESDDEADDDDSGDDADVKSNGSSQLQKMEDSESETEIELSKGQDQGTIHNIELKIPENLKRHLEDDCYFIKRKNQLVKLPAEPSVITILEAYVKNFALNIIYGTVEKSRPYPARENHIVHPERSVDLCKEVMEGLRVFFNFALPQILLYGPERNQFNKMMSTKANMKREMLDPQSPLVQSPRLRSATKQAMSPARAESSPKIPRLSPKAIKHEKMSEDEDEENDSNEENDSEDFPCKRMTRHSYQAELKKEKDPKEKDPKEKDPVKTPQKIMHSQEGRRSRGSKSKSLQGKNPDTDSKTESGRRGSLRSSARHFSANSPDHDKEEKSEPKKTTLKDRITPPPPLLIPNPLLSQEGSSTSGQSPTFKSKCSTPTRMANAAADREVTLNRILSWKIIPDRVFAQNPPDPAVIYGAHHFLRLFVKLPELLKEMNIPGTKSKMLQKHLEMFIEYLSDRHEELFSASSYIDASEIVTIGRRR